MNLKKYLLSNFHDDKYFGKSLIYIFLNDKKYYNELIMKSAVKPEADQFLSRYSKQLEKAKAISTDAFKKLKHEELIDEYINGLSKEEPPKAVQNDKPSEPNNSTSIFEDEHRDVYISLLCFRDRTKMHVVKTAKCWDKKNSKQITFPIYKCPKCKKLYTSIPIFPNLHQFKVSGKEYMNLSPNTNSADYKKPSSVKVRHIISANFFIVANGANTTCISKDCSEHNLRDIYAVFKNQTGKKSIRKIKWCDKCNAYYLPISQLNRKDFPYNIINQDQLQDLEDQYQKQLEEKTEQRRQQKENKKLAAEVAKQKQLQKMMLPKIKNNEIKKNKSTIPKPDEDMVIIDAKDFVVRRSVFKCMHNDHTIDDIIAIITIIDRRGNEQTAKISAGYCAACDVYFIMESTYIKLKKQGIPLCRVSDEKNYLKSSTSTNGMQLANESILMQYGYNVSQEEGLSETTRHKILATLIDKHIMSKSAIISYLDFFISQRQSQSRYQLAIAKWELDRNFVEDYKKGKYQEIGVLGLHY